MPHAALRDRICAYCHRAEHSLQELAHTVALHPKVLSRKLNGSGGAALTQPEIKRIIKTLTAWQAITTQAEAQDLLALGQFAPSSFTPEEWAAAPLNGLDAAPLPMLPTPPSLPAHQTPLRPAVAPRYRTLPAPLTRLIGREWAVDHMQALLNRPDVRLVTLVGPGGTGKTRLALAVAGSVAEAFGDGVCFVALASVTDPTLVVPTIAHALELPDVPGVPALDHLAAYLGPKQLLLVLDNFEQVLQAAPAVSDLLEAAPQVTVLVTSRAVLHVYGEREWSVPPLDLPDLQHLPELPEHLAQYAAIQLFTERAQAVKPDFALTNDNARAVAEMCILLDGLPLALELAAARSKLFAPQALLHQLATARLPVLTAGARNLPERQQTLRAAIAWSYALLTADEQQLWRRLAVFAGGCTVAAAEAVCITDDLLVLHGLQSLLDQSMVQQVAGVDGEPRFMMLETLREYALEQLHASGEADTVQHRHAAFFLAVAQESSTGLRGAEQVAWLARLQGELDNFRAALHWCCTAATPLAQDLGLRLAGSLGWFWHFRNAFVEGRTWVTRVLQQTGGLERSAARSTALLAAGVLAWGQGNHAEGRALLTECLAQARQSDNQGDVGYALVVLGLDGAVIRGDYGTGRAQLDEGAALLRTLNDSWGLGYSLYCLGTVELQRDLPASEAWFHQSAALFRTLGNPWGLALVLGDLAYVTHRQGNDATARSLAEESVSLLRQLGERSLLARSLAWLALLDEAQGSYTEALLRHYEILQLRRDLAAGPWLIASALGNIGHTLPYVNDHERAARLLAAAAALRERSGVAPPQHEAVEEARAISTLETVLGELRFRQTWAAGTAMTLEQALAEAAAPPAPTNGSAESAPDAPPARARNTYPAGLTAREVEVLRLVANGLTDKEIAAALVVSTRTVSTHLTAIYGKLLVNSRSAATRFAVEHGLG